MSKRKPNKVFAVDGMVVLARHSKGAISVARDYSGDIDLKLRVSELSDDMASIAVNREAIAGK